MGCRLLQGLLQGGGPPRLGRAGAGRWSEKKTGISPTKMGDLWAEKPSKISKHGEELDVFSNMFFGHVGQIY